MITHYFWQRAISVLLSAVLAIPFQAAAGAESVRHSIAPISDQALDVGGALSGRVVDTEGTPLSGVRVKLRFNRELVAEATTDAAGQFELQSLRGGVHTIEAAGTVRVLRLWTHDAAPPAAYHEALTLAVSLTRLPAVRGQSPDTTVVPVSGQGSWLTPYTGAWIALGALVGLVVAVNSDDDDAS
jgi:hypothetical protein